MKFMNADAADYHREEIQKRDDRIAALEKALRFMVIDYERAQPVPDDVKATIDRLLMVGSQQ
jgi:hypothetical protein